MTEKELAKRCEYWQKVLRLQDWRIFVRVVGTEEMNSGEAGACEIHQDSKLATIKILAEEVFNPTSDMSRLSPVDLEQTLVHEMLHILTDRIFNSEADDYERIMQEQAIEFVSEALVRLERGEKE